MAMGRNVQEDPQEGQKSVMSTKDDTYRGIYF